MRSQSRCLSKGNERHARENLEPSSGDSSRSSRRTSVTSVRTRSCRRGHATRHSRRRALAASSCCCFRRGEEHVVGRRLGNSVDCDEEVASNREHHDGELVVSSVRVGCEIAGGEPRRAVTAQSVGEPLGDRRLFVSRSKLRPTRASANPKPANLDVARDLAMARPGLEPGTPRFSVVTSERPSGAKSLETGGSCGLASRR
jgi:hypothetical protein